MFISDYVQTKYHHIYEEAAELYNNLNHLHPRKPDLRRTDEYRLWRNTIAQELSMPLIIKPRQKKRQFVHTTHRNIPLAIRVEPTSSLIVLPDAENQNSAPERPPPEIQSSPSPVESPPAETPTSPPPSESPPSAHIHQKIMQLRIPLMTPSQNSPKSVQTPVETPDEMVETVIDEGMQSDILYPSLMEEVAPEIIDKIIAELRQDPQLKDIVAGVEQQIQEEEVGLDIDLPDYSDPLEEELQNIFW